MIDAVPFDNSPRHPPLLGATRPLSDSATLVCGGCGCWCDDIRLPPNQPGVFHNACSRGQAYFQQQGLFPPAANEAGSWDALVADLRQARCPLFTGLHHSDVETHRWAVALANLCRGRIDPFLSTAARAKTLAFQQGGDVSATWGEVKNRADLIIYWRCQPHDAPRFRQRYGDLAEGYFVQPDQRQVFVLDRAPDPAAWESLAAEQFISLEEHDPFTFEALARATVESPAAIDSLPAEWQPLLAAMQQAKYIALVVGQLRVSSLTDTEYSASSERVAGLLDVEAGVLPHAGPAALAVAYQCLQHWVSSQNTVRRCVAVPFPSSADQGHVAQAVLTWRTGYPLAVDFSTGQPRHDALAYHWETSLNRDEVDLVILLGDGHPTSDPVPPDDSARLDVPKSPRETASPWSAAYQRLREWSQTHPVWELGRQPVVGAPARFLGTAAMLADDAPRAIVGRPDGVWLPHRLPPRVAVNRQGHLLQQLWERLAAPTTPSRPTPVDDPSPPSAPIGGR